jgi:5-methyltetrahydropteroyltriglutamate--homocysteine methyltransferase
MTEKFRADQVGSLLRPDALLAARRGHDAGELTDASLREAEDQAITTAVRRQEATGIDVVTDGEFRRRDFRSGFAQAVDGIEMSAWDMPWHSAEGATRLRSIAFTATARLRQRERLAGGEVAFVRSLTSAPVKATLIAPGFLAERFWKDGATSACYSSREEFAAEVAAITRAEITALIADGVRYIQLDNPGYGAYLGSHAGHDPAGFERVLSADIAAVQGVERPDGVTIGLHVCRGNQSSKWMGEGDYEPVAEELFGRLPVDRLLLEYDDERAGGFAPLRFVPPGAVSVLGLVSSKTGELETADSLRARIDEAAKYVAYEDLALSPQCGFASIAEGGNLLTEAEQYAKLALVADVARLAWGNEGPND